MGSELDLRIEPLARPAPEVFRRTAAGLASLRVGSRGPARFYVVGPLTGQGLWVAPLTGHVYAGGRAGPVYALGPADRTRQAMS